MASTMAIGTVIGSLCGGFIIDNLGIHNLLLTNVLISCASAFLALLSLFCSKFDIYSKFDKRAIIQQ